MYQFSSFAQLCPCINIHTYTVTFSFLPRYSFSLILLIQISAKSLVLLSGWPVVLFTEMLPFLVHDAGSGYFLSHRADLQELQPVAQLHVCLMGTIIRVAFSLRSCNREEIPEERKHELKMSDTKR